MISLRSVTKSYGSDVAVEDLSLEVADGELCVLLGPSGCGKTTTLKMVNRLVEPTSGEILIDGEDVQHVDVVQLRRRIGYVMQHGGLFPHQRVADNVATVPRLLGWPREKVAARVDELLALVGLDPSTFARRYPHELSGGERQRVGVARALGGDPPVLLMDEPFGAVDPLTRQRLQREFKELQARLCKTVILVTHDIDEAVLLGTRIAVLAERGMLQQFGTPSEVLGAPASSFVAEFVGTDRGLRRLSVTTAERGDLLDAPSVALDATLAEVRSSLGGTVSTLAVVLDSEQLPVGWIGEEQLRSRAPNDDAVESSGAVALALARPLAAVVPLGTALDVALSAILQDDDGVVAVLDGGRYAGVLTLRSIHQAVRRPAPVPSRGAGTPRRV